MVTADEFCDHVAFIVDGRIACIDSPRALKLAHGERTVRVGPVPASARVTRTFRSTALPTTPHSVGLRDCYVQTIHTREATLADVFIRVTGRGWHDATCRDIRDRRAGAVPMIGFSAATAFVVVCSIALLHWLPADVAALFLPVVLLENILINTFYFVSALLLLERGEGTFAAQSVTPLRADEYLASKLVTLTALSLVESLAIATALTGLNWRLIVMSLGIALAAALFCLQESR